MTIDEVLKVAAAILVALGGGAGIVGGLSNYFGKLWADRLMVRERAEHDRALERLRSELATDTARDVESIKASLELSKAKLFSAHQDKVAMYRMVADIVADMIVDLGAAKGQIRQLQPSDAIERVLRFERDRLRAYAYLAMFAPQHVMDAFDGVIDYLLEALEGSTEYDFVRIRELGIAMLNEIRIDIGIAPAPVAYRGRR